MEFTKAWFEESSTLWMENKRRLKSGAFQYICQHTYKYGKKCNRDVYKDSDMCRQHDALRKIGKLL